MRKVSVWAFQHRWTARFIIVSLYFFLNFLGIATGDVIYDLGITFPETFMISLLITGTLLLFYYPSRKNPDFSYRKKKAFDVMLGICTFCMVCFTGNQQNVERPFTLTASVVSLPVATIHPDGNTSSVKNYTAKTKHKISRKETRQKVKSFLKQLRKKYRDLSDGEKILFVFLTVVVSLALIALLAALACSIACAGSEVLAYILFFVGTGAIVYLAAHIIHKIVRKRNKPMDDRSVPALPVS